MNYFSDVITELGYYRSVAQEQRYMPERVKYSNISMDYDIYRAGHVSLTRVRCCWDAPSLLFVSLISCYWRRSSPPLGLKRGWQCAEAFITWTFVVSHDTRSRLLFICACDGGVAWTPLTHGAVCCFMFPLLPSQSIYYTAVCIYYYLTMGSSPMISSSYLS